MINWIKKNEKLLFWVICISSLVIGVIAVETKTQWLFMIAFGMTGLLIASGFIYKLYKKYFKHNGKR